MCEDLKSMICFPKTLAESQGGTDVLPFPIHRPTTHGEACLVLIHPCSPNLGHRYTLGDNDALIGRQPGVDVVSADSADEALSQLRAGLQHRLHEVGGAVALADVHEVRPPGRLAVSIGVAGAARLRGE